MNNFLDEIAEVQAKIRTESEKYAFWIKAGFLTKPEAKKLFEWYMQNGNIVDLKGDLRCRLLKQLRRDEILPAIKKEKINLYPSKLQEALKKRIPNLAGPDGENAI